MPDPAGFLLVDKPEGISSFDVIRRLRKITGIRRIGHTGTLDPFATGLMIVCFGNYTRLAQFPEADAKTYEATLELGSQTDSGDLTGSVIGTKPVPSHLPDMHEIEEKAILVTELPIPAYSAIKISGKRAYEYARKGEAIEMPVRPVNIHSFEILDVSRSRISYRCRVSKGTYIRSLSEWIATELGTLGTTISLRRTAIGMMDVSSAYTLDYLETHPPIELFSSPDEILYSLPRYSCSPEEELSLFHGRKLINEGVDCPAIMMLSQSNKLLGIGTRESGIISVKVNLH